MAGRYRYQATVYCIVHGLGYDTSKGAERVLRVPVIVLVLKELLKPIPTEPPDLVIPQFRLDVDSDSLSLFQERCFLEVVLALLLHPFIQIVSVAYVGRSFR